MPCGRVMPRSFANSEFVQQKSWHSSVCSTVVLLLHGCLFKPSRMLPRRDCHAWANLRTQNQISLCGKLLVVCQERLCSVYLNNQANQAWPPPLQWKARICQRALLVSVFVIQSRNSVIQIDRRDEECNMSRKWGLKTYSSFRIVFPVSALSFLWVYQELRLLNEAKCPVVLLSELNDVQTSCEGVRYM